MHSHIHAHTLHTYVVFDYDNTETCVCVIEVLFTYFLYLPCLMLGFNTIDLFSSGLFSFTSFSF